MKSIARAAAVAFLALFAFASLPALAGETDKGFGLGLNVGLGKGRDAAEASVTYGAQARIRLTQGLGLEALASYRKDEYESGTGEKILKIEKIPVQLSLQLFLVPGGVQPYLQGGAGWYYTRSTGLGSNVSDTVTENKFGVHAGGGVDVRLARSFRLHVDVRYVWLDVSSLQDAENRYNVDRKADYWNGTAGFTYYF